jgi:predicted nucleic acid-binding protein
LIVLDANILIRAVLGRRVQLLLIQYGKSVQFFAPSSVFDEAREHLAAILSRRNVPVADGLAVLNSLAKIVQAIPAEALSGFEKSARQRLIGRDEDDWPVLAAAMALNCSIWTEDADFFGSGVATWTTDRVELYLKNASEA